MDPFSFINSSNLPSFLSQPSQITIPTSSKEEILCIVTPLSKSSLQFIFTQHSLPKPSGDIFKITYDEVEIRQMILSKEINKLNLDSQESVNGYDNYNINSENREFDEEVIEKNETNDLNIDKNVNNDNTEYNTLSFDIKQIMGDRMNDSLQLPVYRIANFGLRVIQEFKYVSLREIFVVWGLKVKEGETEIHDYVKSIEKAFDRLIQVKN